MEPKKPYYLKEYLSFILPYVKPLNPLPNRGNIPSVEVTGASEPVDAEAEEDEATIDPNDNSQVVMQTTESQECIPEDPGAPKTSQVHGVRRKRHNEVDAAMVKFSKTKIEKKWRSSNALKNSR